MKKILILVTVIFSSAFAQLEPVFRFNDVEAFVSIDFFDETSGFVVDSEGELYLSVDGGVSITPVTVPGNKGITKVHITRLGKTYICGHNGMVKYSTDRGQNWTDVSVTAYPGFKIGFITSLSESRIIAAGDDGYYASSSDGGVTWSVSRVGNDNITKVVFKDQNRGFLFLERGGIFQTIDGGKTWSGYSLPYSAYPFVGAFFHENKWLFLTKNYVFVFSGDDGQTFTRSNGANDTRVSFTEEIEPGRFFVMLDRPQLYVIDFTSLSYQITSSWNPPAGKSFTGMSFNGSKAFFSAKGPDLLYLNTSGLTFTSTLTTFGDRPIRAINTKSDTEWVVTGLDMAGKKGKVARTTNSGQTWALLHDNQWVTNCTFVTTSEAVRINESSVSSSIDYGATWGNLIQNQTGVIISDQFFSRSEGFFILTDTLSKPGEQAFSKVMKYNLSISTSLNLTGARLTHLKFTSKTNGWVLKDSSRFYTTQNGGTAWGIKPEVTPLISDYLRIGDYTGILVTRTGRIMKTTDIASTWQTIFSDSTVAFSSIDSRGPVFVAAGDSGACFVSTDSRSTWRRKPTNTKFNFSIVKMIASDKFLLGTKTGGLYTADITGTLEPAGTGEDSPLLPEKLVVGNYPNPFNPETAIRYALPAAGYAKGVVYDFLGREVATLIDGVINAGSHEIKFNASGFPSGVYIFRLETGKNSAAVKMVLLR